MKPNTAKYVRQLIERAKPGMPRWGKRGKWNKTGRNGGAQFALIRFLANRMKTFTIDNLTPTINRDNARRCCNYLVSVGELKVITHGKPGLPKRRTIYTIQQLNPKESLK